MVAARPLFSQFGLKKTTTDDIAKRAHISKATIYRYYGNKQEVFNDVIDGQVKRLFTAISTAVDDESSAVGKLRACLLSRMRRSRELAKLLQTNRKDFGENWRQGAEFQEQILNREKKIITDILRFGESSGELQIKNAELTAHLMVVSVQSIEYSWIFGSLNVAQSVYVDHVLDVIINGIRKR